jgi:hypothetical protein
MDRFELKRPHASACLTVPNPISVEIGAKRDAHVERGT